MTPLPSSAALTRLRSEDDAFAFGDTHFNTVDVPQEVVAFVREFDGTNRYVAPVVRQTQAHLDPGCPQILGCPSDRKVER